MTKCEAEVRRSVRQPTRCSPAGLQAARGGIATFTRAQHGPLTRVSPSLERRAGLPSRILVDARGHARAHALLCARNRCEDIEKGTNLWRKARRWRALVVGVRSAVQPD